METKTYPDFHTLGWMSMTANVTFMSGIDKKWFLNKSASTVQ